LVKTAETMLAHHVYFVLKNNSPSAIEKLLAACRKYLTDHPGTVNFSLGTRASGLNRAVNDKDFDVCLCIVFASRAAHDQYQTHPHHIDFINENHLDWASVRVSDSDCV
jgi:hypothetical protein